MNDEARWVQRFANFGKAFARLKAAAELARRRPLSDLEEQGLLRGFADTYELAWRTLKDFYEAKGVEEIYGPAKVARIAFRQGVIANDEIWMNMLKDRNMIAHAYNKEAARKIAAAILGNYVGEFAVCHEKLGQLKKAARDETSMRRKERLAEHD
ncbi:MAG: nucleotidyltransferase substrate binding protein [Gammaproteobacteria bacterium]